MSDEFELQDPQDARAFLTSFGGGATHKGESYFREGRVHELRPVVPGTHYSITVQGSELYTVDLSYQEEDGWMGSCTCPMEFECKHVYAAMKALLAEHSVASVRGISAGASGKTPPAPVAAKAAPVSTQTLAQELVAALGRPLKADETKFLHKISSVFARCRQTRTVSHWDFDELGLSLGGYGWGTLQIWPAVPQTELEFWLYVANAALEHGRKLPAFMESITDLSGIHDRLQQWRRSQEVERWKHTLLNAGDLDSDAARGTRGVFDVRLKVGEKSAELEWKRPGQEVFAPFKQTHLNQFVNDYREGLIEFPTEAEFLWQILQPRLNFGYGLHLNYNDPTCQGILARALRMHTLVERVVNAEGQPLVRVAEPLRWEIVPAQTEQDDYRFRLVQADGQPLPPILCALPGQPALYLTRAAVFTGPPVVSHVLKPGVENLIPAPALETRGGVKFLHGLGAELPPRVRDRVRSVPMEVVISCELRPTFPGSKNEMCVFRVQAESKDGKVKEQWDGHHWGSTEQRFGLTPLKEKETETIALYDRAVLQEVPRTLEPLGLKWDYQGFMYVRVTKKFPEMFAAWLKTVPLTLTVRLAGELNSLLKDDVSGQVRLDVTETTIDWFDLRVVLDVTDTTLTPEEIKLLLNAKGGYVRLGDKGWRRLKFNLTTEDDERLARLGLTPHEMTAEPQRLHALQLADDSAKKFLPEQQVAQIQRRASEIKARVTPDLPKGVTAELRPYQLEGFHFLAYLSANHFGGILADDMGLGKTLQTLAWLVWLREQSGGAGGTPTRPSLVVCPKSVMDNWHAEAARFTPRLRVKSWPASELDKLAERLDEADLHVLNYSQLRMLGETLVPVQWLTVILDEGQYIKNPSSQTAQVARALRAEHRLVLSGTPIENRLLDLWSLMSFAMPGVLSSRAQFAKLFDAKDDPFARRRLSARVRPFLLRRTKTQVAKDLPDRVEEDLFCEIEGEQKLLYRAELKQAQQMLLKVQTQKQLNKDRFHFLTSLLRLRQICCHPALVKPGTKAASAKLEALLEQLEPIMEEGNKVLVFSQFVELLGLLKPALAERGWPMFYLAGETENRGKLVKEFQAAEGAAIFLISLKAGGFGLNLTAASYVVLFDPWWNPAVENQAIDRTHRIGQANKVMAYRLLIKDSVEEKIRALQKKKTALAEDVLGEEKFSQSLTLSDLQFLFAD